MKSPRRIRTYKLVGKVAVPCNEAEGFVERFEITTGTGQDPWRVAETGLGKKWVSTVFLGVDHNFMGSGPPRLFESMIFGPGDEDADMFGRCSTWEEAEAMHEEAVKAARSHLRVIK